MSGMPLTYTPRSSSPEVLSRFGNFGGFIKLAVGGCPAVASVRPKASPLEDRSGVGESDQGKGHEWKEGQTRKAKGTRHLRQAVTLLGSCCCSSSVWGEFVDSFSFHLDFFVRHTFLNLLAFTYGDRNAGRQKQIFRGQNATVRMIIRHASSKDSACSLFYAYEDKFNIISPREPRRKKIPDSGGNLFLVYPGRVATQVCWLTEFSVISHGEDEILSRLHEKCAASIREYPRMCGSRLFELGEEIIRLLMWSPHSQTRARTFPKRNLSGSRARDRNNMWLIGMPSRHSEWSRIYFPDRCFDAAMDSRPQHHRQKGRQINFAL